MFEKKSWINKVPKGHRKVVRKTFSKCVASLGTSPTKLRKLLKANPKKGKAVDLRIHDCLLKSHPILREGGRRMVLVPFDMEKLRELGWQKYRALREREARKSRHDGL